MIRFCRNGASNITIAAMLLVCGTGTAVAQDAAAGDNEQGIQDIIVTAQKRGQSGQDVGITLSVVTGDALAERGATSALPVYVHSRMASVDPEELRKLDERIERDCDIVRRHLFGQGEESGSEEELGLTRERIRQITRRAARVIGDLAANNPRFTTEQQAGTSTVLPYARQLNLDAANVRVTEPEFVQPAPGADIEVFDTVPVGIILTRDNLARH